MSDQNTPAPEYPGVPIKEDTPQEPYPPQQQPYPPQQQPYPPQQQPYPPQQQPYPQQQAPPAQQLYPQTAPIQQQPLPVKQAWGTNPTPMLCVNCKTQQTSVPTKKIGFMSWIVVGIIAFILFDLVLWPCIPCAFFALLIDGLKDTQHVCPNCNHVNGVKKMV